MKNQILGSKTVAQIAIVVRDIEAARQRFADLFGMPVPEIIITAPGNEANMTYRGQNSTKSCRFRRRLHTGDPFQRQQFA